MWYWMAQTGCPDMVVPLLFAGQVGWKTCESFPSVALCLFCIMLPHSAYIFRSEHLRLFLCANRFCIVLRRALSSILVQSSASPLPCCSLSCRSVRLMTMKFCSKMVVLRWKVGTDAGCYVMECLGESLI